MSEIKTVKDAAATIKLLDQKILLLEKQVELQDAMIKKMVEQQDKKDKKDSLFQGQRARKIKEFVEEVENLHSRMTNLDEKQVKLYEIITTLQKEFPEVLKKLVSDAKKDVVKQYKNRGKRPLRIVNPFR